MFVVIAFTFTAALALPQTVNWKSIMDAQKAMKIVYDELKKAKDFSAEGTDIMISPKDFKDALSGTELWRTVQKMSKDYDICTLLVFYTSFLCRVPVFQSHHIHTPISTKRKSSEYD